MLRYIFSKKKYIFFIIFNSLNFKKINASSDFFAESQNDKKMKECTCYFNKIYEINKNKEDLILRNELLKKNVENCKIEFDFFFEQQKRKHNYLSQLHEDRTQVNIDKRRIENEFKTIENKKLVVENRFCFFIGSVLFTFLSYKTQIDNDYMRNFIYSINGVIFLSFFLSLKNYYNEKNKDKTNNKSKELIELNDKLKEIEEKEAKEKESLKELEAKIEENMSTLKTNSEEISNKKKEIEIFNNNVNDMNNELEKLMKSDIELNVYRKVYDYFNHFNNASILSILFIDPFCDPIYKNELVFLFLQKFFSHLPDWINHISTFQKYFNVREQRVFNCEKLEENGLEENTSKEVLLGYDNIIKEMHSFYNNRFSGERNSNNLILHGPPGNGKTCLVKKSILHYLQNNNENENDCFYFLLNPFLITQESDFNDFIVQLKGLDRKKVFIFFDELDGIISTNAKNNLTAQFKTFINESNEKYKNVFIIGATNNFNLLDGGCIRDGRFDKKLEIGNPDMETRKAIIQNTLSKVVKEVEGKVEEVEAKVQLLFNFITSGESCCTTAKIVEDFFHSSDSTIDLKINLIQFIVKRFIDEVPIYFGFENNCSYENQKEILNKELKSFFYDISEDDLLMKIKDSDVQQGVSSNAILSSFFKPNLDYFIKRIPCLNEVDLEKRACERNLISLLIAEIKSLIVTMSQDSKKELIKNNEMLSGLFNDVLGNVVATMKKQTELIGEATIASIQEIKKVVTLLEQRNIECINNLHANDNIYKTDLENLYKENLSEQEEIFVGMCDRFQSEGREWYHFYQKEGKEAVDKYASSVFKDIELQLTKSVLNSVIDKKKNT